MATPPAPKPKGVASGIKSLPKPALIAIPLVGALAFYLYQRRKSAAAAPTTAATPVASAVDTSGSNTGGDTGGGAGAIAGGTDFQGQIDAISGQESAELTDLDAVKKQNTQLLATENKDLSVDNASLATDKADLATDKADLNADNSGLVTPSRVGGSTTAKKKVAPPAPKIAKPQVSPKVTGAKTAPAKKTLTTPKKFPGVFAGGGNRGGVTPPVKKAPVKKK